MPVSVSRVQITRETSPKTPRYCTVSHFVKLETFSKSFKILLLYEARKWNELRWTILLSYLKVHMYTLNSELFSISQRCLCFCPSNLHKFVVLKMAMLQNVVTLLNEIDIGKNPGQFVWKVYENISAKLSKDGCLRNQSVCMRPLREKFLLEKLRDEKAFGQGLS
ncbi:hypothetical protein OS493_036068 [Desmophyllum pertusum]|uniref:Uncharacterized protein n=1 Tax=Desmophyllum pertusum TaxID=174260 RepID=A0A9W9YUT1_9CNID|nr:hypothetical protein OS493_036068 [Desmophyllum pertusum]